MTKTGFRRYRGTVDEVSVIPLTGDRKLLTLDVDGQRVRIVLLPADVEVLVERLEADDLPPPPAPVDMDTPRGEGRGVGILKWLGL